MTDFFLLQGLFRSFRSRGKVKNLRKSKKCCKVSRIILKCCKVLKCQKNVARSRPCIGILLQGLHSSSSGQAPENDAAKDTVVADDDASSAVPQRAAQDLLSAWTASDLDALDAASDACYHAPSSSDSTNNGSSSRAKNAKQASRHRRHPAIAGIPPSQAGTDTRHEAVAGGRPLQARGGIPSVDWIPFCALRVEDGRSSAEEGGGIADRTSDDRLRGGRRREEGQEGGQGASGGLSTLTIEELGEENEMDENEEEEDVSDTDSNDARQLLATMK